MKRLTATALLLAAAFASIAITGCSSVPDPATIPPETSVAELSQRGQSALDENNYKAAEVYYQIIIDRFGGTPEAVVSAEFEIAHIRIKQKKWNDAKGRLEAIIERYETTGGAGLPPEFLVLARNDYKKIPPEHGGPEAVAE